MKIVHQTQPTLVSCVSTCIAMLKGVPAKEIIDKYHKGYYEKTMDNASEWITIEDILIAENIKHIIPGNSSKCHHVLFNGNIYLLDVPSLNVKGGMHCIIADFRNDKMVIYDPAKGFPDRKYYETFDDIVYFQISAVIDL